MGIKWYSKGKLTPDPDYNEERKLIVIKYIAPYPTKYTVRVGFGSFGRDCMYLIGYTDDEFFL